MLALPVLLVYGVGIGSIPVPPSEILAALTHRSTDPVVTAIVGELQLPRALVAMTAGGMLGLAGALLQTVLINPLVEPTLVGVSPGAVLAIVRWGVFGRSVAQTGGLAVVADDPPADVITPPRPIDLQVPPASEGRRFSRSLLALPFPEVGMERLRGGVGGEVTGPAVP